MNHIAKKDLIVGEYYTGICRNSTIARWNGKTFIYERSKFGDVYFEKIHCPEDDNVYDTFKAQSLLENCDIILPLEL